MRVLFRLFALLSLGAAAYHFIGLLHPAHGPPLWRHVLFVAIDLFCAYGFLRRPLWFVWFFGALAVQQCYGHGGSLLGQFAENRISWLDLGVVLFVIVALTCLVFDYRGKTV